MGIFSSIMHKIFDRAAVNAAPTGQPAGPTPSSASVTLNPAPLSPSVDIREVLDNLAKHSKEKLDWKHSIVDLMKLVGIESTLTNRKELASELHYSGDMNDSASMNIWLHKEVLKKLSENGGRVPEELL